ncbi:hypothetical protein L2E82_04352 [Cichorium intybus]|uniref:Uncharacterized protein n=1 Tax=Cichorium intybus TaxID=13427 RepID=A0ACB9H5A8_CICIN|nr:hypothetical protein L2E82_04352 [Cichorium intybus]
MASDHFTDKNAVFKKLKAKSENKQHGWTDGGKIDAKYTSRASQLYKQLLAKEVAKSCSEAVLPSSPSPKSSDNFTSNETLKESSLEKDDNNVLATMKAPSKNVKKPLGAKKSMKTGGLGARKLNTKKDESLYDQKPEEPIPQVSTSASSTQTQPQPSTTTSYTSRFEYVDDFEDAEGPRSMNSTNHITTPKPSSFFAEYGMDTGFMRKSSSMKVQGSAAISSADLFGEESPTSNIDLTATEILNRLSFQAQQDISSLKNMAGETGKKLTSMASTLMNDLQDRIL